MRPVFLLLVLLFFPFVSSLSVSSPVYDSVSGSFWVGEFINASWVVSGGDRFVFNSSRLLVDGVYDDVFHEPFYNVLNSSNPDWLISLSGHNMTINNFVLHNIVNGSGANVTLDGKYGAAAAFNGSYNYFIADSSFLDFHDNPPFSLAFWVKPNSHVAKDYEGLVARQFSWGCQRSILGVVTCAVRTDTNIYGVGGAYIPDNVWSYVTMVFNGSKVFQYINSVYNGSSSTVTGEIRNLETFAIGLYGYSFNGGYPGSFAGFNGLIDEVRIWNTTLTQVEIGAEMISALPVKGDGLVASYSFDYHNSSHVFDTNYFVGRVNSSGGLVVPAYNFHGNGEAVDTGVDFDINNNYTFSLWFNSDYASTSNTLFSDLHHLRCFIHNLYGVYCQHDTDSGVSMAVRLPVNYLHSGYNNLVYRTNTNGYGSLYINGVDAGSGGDFASGPQIGCASGTICVGGTGGVDVYSFNGVIGDFLIFNRSLSDVEVSFLYNASRNDYSVSGFVVNASGVVVVPVVSNGSDYVSFVGSSRSLNSSFLSFDFGGYSRSGGVNFTRGFDVNISVFCPLSYGVVNLSTFVNGSYFSSVGVSCSSFPVIYPFSFVPSDDGFFNISWSVVSVFDSFVSDSFPFYGDVHYPVVVGDLLVVSNFSFNNASAWVWCDDYNLVSDVYLTGFLNDDLVFELSHSSAPYNKSVVIEPFFGVNRWHGYCEDIVGHRSYFNVSKPIFRSSLFLWDEFDNIALDLDTVSGARLYFDDNSSFFDFKSSNVSVVNFTGVGDLLRLQLEYSGGAFVTRYLNVSLINLSSVRFCANPDNITHYEQLIISSRVRPVLVYNVFAGCFVAAANTRFAYQDSNMLRFYTVNSHYNIVAFNNGVRVDLAGVDGGSSGYFNIDTLLFNIRSISVADTRRSLSIDRYSNDSVSIHFFDLDNSSSDANLTIFRVDSGDVVYSFSNFSDNNNFVVIFDFGVLFNVSENTAFKAVLTYSSGGEVFVISRYFNGVGNSAPLSSGLGVGISLFLVVFGLPFVAGRSVWSWFGIIIFLLSLGVLGITAYAWYVPFVAGLNVICLIFTVILLSRAGEAVLT